MNRKIHLLAMALALGLYVSAQSEATPTVLAAGGQITEGSGLRLEWTLGEFAVMTLQTPFGAITEGYHQPEILLMEQVLNSNNTIAATSVGHVVVAPNPVSTALMIRVPPDWSQNAWTVTLYDAQGRPLHTQKWEAGPWAATLDMALHPSGSYWLRICTADAKTAETIKIIKIQ